ncbi:DUF4446 family protein [Selenomonas sputigena]|uniref:DUF4446 family protein n=1 Tax=Selenomonas sputigena TaxID=69823 RepID=A0ABV3X8G2_9FIRM
MDSKLLADFLEKNETFLIVFLMLLVIILLVTVIYLMYSVSKMKSRYRQMMTGVEGANLERMLIGHINEMKGVAEESKQIKQENKRLDKILQTATTRIGIVRFSAFADMGSDLSYAVAMLDAHNNGVLFSSIFAREDSRSYVKPIEAGRSTYKLTREEAEALDKAMSVRVD